MKGKSKNCDMRYIGGTNIIPISSLAFRVEIFFLHPWIIPGHIFTTHVWAVVIAEIIKHEYITNERKT